MTGEKIWSKMDTDTLLDMLFSGETVQGMADRLGHSRERVRDKIAVFRENWNGRTDRYQPLRRYSRANHPLSEVEIDWIKHYRRNRFSLRSLSRLMQRELSDMGCDTEDLSRIFDMRRVGTGVDLILAYRYLYYVKGVSILSDAAYDRLEAEEMEFGAGGHVLKERVGSDVADDYPLHIRALGLYLAFKYASKEKTGRA